MTGKLTDPSAFSELSANVAVNPSITNIKIFNLFVGVNAGKVQMGSNTEMGNSMSSLLFADSNQSWTVESIKLEDFVRKEKIDSPLFMKIDIEGGEYFLIPSLTGIFKNYETILYLSIHPDIIAQTIPGKKIHIRIKRRLVLLIAHIRLLIGIRNLGFTYDAYGNRINLWKGLLRIFVGDGLMNDRSFVAMKRPWK